VQIKTSYLLTYSRCAAVHMVMYNSIWSIGNRLTEATIHNVHIADNTHATFRFGKHSGSWHLLSAPCYQKVRDVTLRCTVVSALRNHSSRCCAQSLNQIHSLRASHERRDLPNLEWYSVWPSSRNLFYPPQPYSVWEEVWRFVNGF